MVKRSPAPAPEPQAEQEAAPAAPAKKPRNKTVKVPAAEAGDKTRAAMAAQPDKAPMTSQQASQPDKAPAGGWGETMAGPKNGDRKYDDVLKSDVVFRDGKWYVDKEPEKEVGWGLDGKAVEAAAAPPKGPRVRKSKKDDASAEDDDQSGANLTGMARDLISGVERIERLAEERAALGDDIKEVFTELKGKGYSSGTLRKVLARRQMDPEKRREQDKMLALYEEALEGA